MTKQRFNALSKEERKAEQKRLQEAGHYTDTVDGSWGKATEDAYEREDKSAAAREDKSAERDANKRKDEIRLKEIELEEKKAGNKEKEVDAAGAEVKAKIARKLKYDQEAESAEGVATGIAAKSVAPLTGYGLGRYLGKLTSAEADASQTNRNLSLRDAAKGRLDGLTTSAGARAGAEKAGAMPSSYSGLRVMGRSLPHLIGGGAMLGKGAYVMSGINPDDPYYSQQADKAVGLGMMGTGAGILEKGGGYSVAPGVSPNAGDIAIIESNQLRRKPEVEGPPPGSRAALVAEAKAAGVAGTNRLNMTQLQDALKRIGSKAPSLALPLAAGGLAYALTPNSAQASEDGSAGASNNSEALTNAGIVSGTAAATRYGLSKIPEMAGRALGVGGAMTMPLNAMDMGPNTPDEVRQEQNNIARDYPWLSKLIGGGAREQLDMAQVPERNTGKTDEYATARSLQIPGNIPPNAAQQADEEAALHERAPYLTPMLMQQKKAHEQHMEFENALGEFESLMQQVHATE